MTKIPGDFMRVMRQSGLDEFFVECPYVPRAEYVRWIVSAKRPVTRRFRIQRAVVRLFAQWKEEVWLARAAWAADGDRALPPAGEAVEAERGLRRSA